jgi:alkane 1-monooxygenase
MKIRAFKYLSPLLIYVGALQAFTLHGINCFIPLIYAWIVIPGLELLIPAQPSNLSEAEEVMAKDDPVYDWILYLIVLLLFPTLWLFLVSMNEPGLTTFERAGRIGSMGMLCGTFGINVGHELGHRHKKYEQWLAKLSLMTSLYMHFFIEHNRGHHKRVATPEDPSSARLNESVFSFWLRSGIFSYVSAWHISAEQMKKRNLPISSIHNEMIQAHIIQALFLVIIYLVFGWPILGYYLISAFMGMLLLETVNYIEHYGLQRKKLANGSYERALPQHSWNSDHVLGRIMLFELSRHSDHHYLASRKYQVLRHHDQAPQMPTGYPGMMLLSLVPPLWFKIMNRRVQLANNPG